MTRSQIDRLGERLRTGPITDELLAQLQEFRGRYAGPMLAVQSMLANRLGLEATARLKTVNTTVEKLRRAKTRLSRMQDIGGVRLVGDWTLHGQDAIVTQIVELFPNSHVYDRRADPSYGYRAVHVVVVLEDCAIEIQVRTLEQDGWAQSMEKLADIVGRDIRYGTEPDELKPLVKQMVNVSAAIAKHEVLRDGLHEVRSSTPILESAIADGKVTAEDMVELREAMAGIPEFERAEKKMAETIRTLLEGMAAQLDAMIKGETSKE